ncbi:28S ribosomal protein S30, mitochondrial [Orchesella cincta]|uniref:28S ribosomal protein S30, mitochondrial n=1 Tax=Orchesella cincta TaxID=48709 RepID=A0A1D2MIJ6_ORCCI|nr:28S ribosomal protein S30, mitochondrial [Orchesella cincta]
MFCRSVTSKLRCDRRRCCPITSTSTVLSQGVQQVTNRNSSTLTTPTSPFMNMSPFLMQRRGRSQTRFAYPEGMKAYEDDWTEEAEYPEIDPEIHTWNEYRRKRLQDELDFHMKIRKATCPEAKNLELNMPKQFGYKVFRITEDTFDYDSLAAYKFVTRTHIASNTQLPSQYSAPVLEEQVKHYLEKVKKPIWDVLQFELNTPRSCESDFNEFPHTIDLKKSQSIISQINRVILTVLGQEIEHLKDSQVDSQPNIEAFWQMGGLEPSFRRRNQRKGNEKKKTYYKLKDIKIDDPVEGHLHYIGSPLLQVRCKDPPKNFVSPTDPVCSRSHEEFPDRFPHFLEAYGFRFAENSRFASIIPGHWSGDLHRCNLLAYHGRSHLLAGERVDNKYWSATEENEEALCSQAMLVSFGRLLSQAFYHGFDQFGDLEYPFSTQTVITNGLDWSFFAYQLNTIKFHRLALAKNQKQNVMWGTQSESIFDKENPNELNVNVLGNILKFYLNTPVPVDVENATPYLTSRIQDWDDDKERVLTFFNFREQVCQRIYRTDNLLKFRPPEMYEYEKIYKFYFNTMPIEPRRRFFELPSGFPGSQPWNEPYKLKDPLYESKGIVRLKAEVAARKEKEAIEAAKAADGLKFGVAPAKSGGRRR